MHKIISNSVQETSKITRKWLEDLNTSDENDPKEACVIGLSGHLGSGKTTFVKEVAKLLGVEDEVTSPTFVIMKIYTANTASSDLAQKWSRLVHIDAYRLEKPEEVAVLHFEELISDPHNLILIEWPENIAKSLLSLSNYQKITFSIPEFVTSNENSVAEGGGTDSVGEEVGNNKREIVFE